jgi:hypothetical protein
MKSHKLILPFYTASGDEITKVYKEQCDLFRLRKKLDLNAPKPKVTSYAIKYWDGNFKGVPGYFTVLMDKNGNYIDSFRFNEKTGKIKVFSRRKPTHEIAIFALKNFDFAKCRLDRSYSDLK